MLPSKDMWWLTGLIRPMEKNKNPRHTHTHTHTHTQHTHNAHTHTHIHTHCLKEIQFRSKGLQLKVKGWGSLGGSVSCVRLWLRSWSCGSWVQALYWALCWQLKAWSLLQILCLPLSLCVPPPPPFSFSLSLSQKWINIKKFFFNAKKTHVAHGYCTRQNRYWKFP